MTTTESRPADPAVFFKFRPMDDPRGQSRPSLQVSWCVSNELREVLELEGAKIPHLLISITNGKRELDRYLVPLDDETTYVAFRGQGENKVRATVVYRYDDDFKAMKKALTDGPTRGAYRNNVYDADGNFWTGSTWSESLGCHRLELEDSFERDVPVEMFPKKPSNWWTVYFKTYFGWMIRHDPYDQCSIRRRRWATDPTYVIGVIGPAKLPNLLLPIVIVEFLVIMIVSTLIKVFAAICLAIFGRRRIKWGVIMHPLSKAPAATWYDIGASIYFGTSEHEDYTQKWKYAFIVYNPIVLLVLEAIALITHLIVVHHHKGHPYAGVPLWPFTVGALLLVPALAVVIGALAGIVATLVWIFDKIRGKDRHSGLRKLFNNWHAEREARRRAEFEREMREVYARLEDISCDRVGAKPASEVLPQNVTPKLRYQRLKSRSCDPFSVT